MNVADLAPLPGGAIFHPLVATIEARCRYLHGHSDRVTTLCLALAGVLQLDLIDTHQLAIAAKLHDIGKIGVPDTILHKPGPLDAGEQAAIELHPIVGERILGDTFGVPVRQAVRHHHERWDGAGYPDGLAGAAIPLMARIIAVCDAFDAMTSDRAYRAGMSAERARQILRDDQSRQWDPELVDRFLERVVRPIDANA